MPREGEEGGNHGDSNSNKARQKRNFARLAATFQLAAPPAGPARQLLGVGAAAPCNKCVWSLHVVRCCSFFVVVFVLFCSVA